MVFTLPNYTDKDISLIETKWPSIASYYVYGKEICPTTGTPHLQGYVEWNSSKKFVTAHKIFGGRAHWEKRRATPLLASNYCKKEGLFIEWGTMSSQGSRTDL